MEYKGLKITEASKIVINYGDIITFGSLPGAAESVVNFESVDLDNFSCGEKYGAPKFNFTLKYFKGNLQKYTL